MTTVTTAITTVPHPRTGELGVTTWAGTPSQEPPSSCTPASGTPSPPPGSPGDLDVGAAGPSGASG